jgi:hypothetical protein
VGERIACRLLNEGCLGVRLAVRDVVANGVVEKNRLLCYLRDLAAE